MLKYRIEMPDEKAARLTFEVMFSFGFVFTNQRVKTYLEVTNSHSSLERGDWLWLIIGYDECQNVFGVSRPFGRTIQQFCPIKLDDFLWIMVDGIKDEPKLVTDDAEIVEYFKFTPFW